MMKLARVILTALALSLAAIPQIGSSAPEPVIVPAVLSLTGQVALTGESDRQALTLLQGYVNERGGIRGRPLQFEFLDDGSNPTTTVQVFEQLLSRKLPVVIGPMLTATCHAVSPLVTPAGPVQFCLSPGGVSTKGSYVFLGNFSTLDAYKMAMRYFRDKGLRRVALLEPTDATGQDGEKTFDDVAAGPEYHDITVVAREHFNLADLTVAAQLSKIRAAKPDVLVTWTSGTPLSMILHGMNDAGLDVPVFASHANENYRTMKQFGSLAPRSGLYFPGPQLVARTFLSAPNRAAAEAYFKSYAKAGIDADPTPAALWDIGLIITDAFRHIGPNATAPQIRDYIERVGGFIGASAVFDFRDGSQRGITSNAIVMVRWDTLAQTFAAVSQPGGKPH